MKQYEIDQELAVIACKAIDIRAKTEIELATAEFLQKQADDLVECAENPNLSDSEKLIILEKMKLLVGKIEFEKRMFDDGEHLLQSLVNRMVELQNMIPDE